MPRAASAASAETAPATRVLVADDHEVVRGGVVSIVERQPGFQVVGQAGDGAEAVAAYGRLRPDVVLLDLRMPVMEGVEAVRRIRAMDPAARIVILTTYDSDDDIENALQAGAQAYLLKDATAADIIACIRAVLAGRKFVAPAVAAKLADKVTRVALTAREMDVLRLVCAGKANKEIAADLFITESTVKLHTNYVFTKLGVSNRTEAMRVALERGLVRLPG